MKLFYFDELHLHSLLLSTHHLTLFYFKPFVFVQEVLTPYKWMEGTCLIHNLFFQTVTLYLNIVLAKLYLLLVWDHSMCCNVSFVVLPLYPRNSDSPVSIIFFHPITENMIIPLIFDGVWYKSVFIHLIFPMQAQNAYIEVYVFKHFSIIYISTKYHGAYSCI